MLFVRHKITHVDIEVTENFHDSLWIWKVTWPLFEEFSVYAGQV